MVAWTYMDRQKWSKVLRHGKHYPTEDQPQCTACRPPRSCLCPQVPLPLIHSLSWPMSPFQANAAIMYQPWAWGLMPVVGVGKMHRDHPPSRHGEEAHRTGTVEPSHQGPLLLTTV